MLVALLAYGFFSHLGYLRDPNCPLDLSGDLLNLIGRLILEVRCLVRKIGPAAVLRLCHDFMLLVEFRNSNAAASISFSHCHAEC